MGLEGIVSKCRGSPNRSGGKDEAWVKVKCWDIREFELLGVQRQPGSLTASLRSVPWNMPASAAFGLMAFVTGFASATVVLFVVLLSARF